jgi:AcrR family transcriptional regulator
MKRAGSRSKREVTRAALLDASLKLISTKGIEGTSVLEITESLGISNGSFYYHFKNKEQLLEVLGHALIAGFREQIRKIERNDPAQRIVWGTLMILRHSDDFPEQQAIMLRVLEDPAGRHTDLGEQLIEDIEWGTKAGRFRVKDSFLAMLFCRSILAAAIRLRYQGNSDKRLAVLAAAHTLMSLGVSASEASKLVERERLLLRNAELATRVVDEG